MDSLKICGAAILCVAAAGVMRQLRGEFTLPMKIAAGVIFFACAMSILAPSLAEFNRMTDTGPLSRYAALIIKAVSVALITQFTAELCRDCGEGAIASNIELIGRAEILLLCLPVLSDLLNLAEGILNWK